MHLFSVDYFEQSQKLFHFVVVFIDQDEHLSALLALSQVRQVHKRGFAEKRDFSRTEPHKELGLFVAAGELGKHAGAAQAALRVNKDGLWLFELQAFKHWAERVMIAFAAVRLGVASRVVAPLVLFNYVVFQNNHIVWIEAVGNFFDCARLLMLRDCCF